MGFCLIGEGDLSQELGLARQYEHPEVLDGDAARSSTPATSTSVIVGNPHVTGKNYERLLQEGYQLPDVGAVSAATAWSARRARLAGY
ncbi:hypothetical protein [Massilia phosphatilytica]